MSHQIDVTRTEETAPERREVYRQDVDETRPGGAGSQRDTVTLTLSDADAYRACLCSREARHGIELTPEWVKPDHRFVRAWWWWFEGLKVLWLSHGPHMSSAR